MGFRSIFTKGVALSQAGRTSQHSRKASSNAKQAIQNLSFMHPACNTGQ